MGIFTKQKIVKVEIIDQSEETPENENILNYAIGHMLGGFDGVAHASLLNQNEDATTTFKITYSNGSTEIKTVLNNSLEYNYYIEYI